MSEMTMVERVRRCCCRVSDPFECAKLRYPMSEEQEPCECVCHDNNEDDEEFGA